LSHKIETATQQNTTTKKDISSIDRHLKDPKPNSKHQHYLTHRTNPQKKETQKLQLQHPTHTIINVPSSNPIQHNKMKFSTSTFIVLLSFSTSNNLAMGDDSQYVYYGNLTYLQNYDTPNAWLNSISGVAAWQINDIASESCNYEAGQFILVSQEALGNPGADPKNGTCVMFGDQFGMYLPLWSQAPSYYLAAVDEDPNYSGYVEGNVNQQGQAQVSIADMTFTIRSTQGNGLLSQGSNSDPLFGHCVQQNSVAFIQSTVQNGLWLGMTTSNSPNDPYDSAQVGYIGASASPTSSIWAQPIKYPHWIISTTLSDGSTTDALACQAIPSATQGSWVPINGIYNGNQQKVTYTVGTTTTDSQSVTSTDAWKKSITGTASVGFSFLGASAEVSISVTGEFSESQASSVSQAVAQSESQTFEADFNQGQVWQFVYDAADVCDTAGFTINVEELVLTNGQYDPPCCLPGYFVDDNNPHGPCVAINGIASPCTCSDDICNGAPPSRGLRGSRN
jgi:hypothetical protein